LSQRGTLRYARGGRYEGGFEHGVRCGHGLLRLADGSSYEGDWRDDLFHGIGNLYYKPTDDGNDMCAATPTAPAPL
jgi:hypothetical protein